MNSKPYKSSKKTTVSLAPVTLPPLPEHEQNARELLQQVEQKLSQLRTSLNQQSQDLPLSIFQNKLSTLEIIVLYLHQQKNYSFAEIARILQPLTSGISRNNILKLPRSRTFRREFYIYKMRLLV